MAKIYPTFTSVSSFAINGYRNAKYFDTLDNLILLSSRNKIVVFDTETTRCQEIKISHSISSMCFISDNLILVTFSNQVKIYNKSTRLPERQWEVEGKTTSSNKLASGIAVATTTAIYIYDSQYNLINSTEIPNHKVSVISYNKLVIFSDSITRIYNLSTMTFIDTELVSIPQNIFEYSPTSIIISTNSLYTFDLNTGTTNIIGIGKNTNLYAQPTDIPIVIQAETSNFDVQINTEFFTNSSYINVPASANVEPFIFEYIPANAGDSEYSELYLSLLSAVPPSTFLPDYSQFQSLYTGQLTLSYPGFSQTYPIDVTTVQNEELWSLTIPYATLDAVSSEPFNIEILVEDLVATGTNALPTLILVGAGEKVRRVISYGNGHRVTSFAVPYSRVTSVPSVIPRDFKHTISMFIGCEVFNDPSISNWDFSNIQYTDLMFYDAFRFNQSLNQWDTSSVVSMWQMFYNTIDFNGVVSSWNTENVIDMGYLFYLTAFNQPINNWNVSNVQNMEYMFSASAFNQNINSWDIGKVTSFSSMFDANIVYNQPLDQWQLGAHAANVNCSFMFNGAISFNQDVGMWDVSKVNEFGRMFYSTPAFDQNLTCWAVEHIKYIQADFKTGGNTDPSKLPLWIQANSDPTGRTGASCNP